MALSNELSSDIAAAILVTKDKSPNELSSLKEIVVKVHTTLQEMTEEGRSARRYSRPLKKKIQEDTM